MLLQSYRMRAVWGFLANPEGAVGGGAGAAPQHQPNLREMSRCNLSILTAASKNMIELEVMPANTFGPFAMRYTRRSKLEFSSFHQTLY
jgi:hypothetical protein